MSNPEGHMGQETSPRLVLDGTIMRGKGIASGRNIDPDTGFTSTIARQLPFFKNLGVPNIDKLFPGTININIAPREFKIIAPDYEMRDIPWWTELPEFKESFWLVKCGVKFHDRIFDSYIYYPLPSEVKSHPDTTVELLSERIPNLHYGDPIQLEVDASAIEYKV